jgi:hypothetical protein
MKTNIYYKSHMKRFTLLLVSLALFSLAYGQKIKQTVSHQPYATEQKMMVTQNESRLKAEGDVFFSETFDFADPSAERGWTLPAGWQIKDENDLGHFWTWRAGGDSIKGKYTFEPGHRYSKSKDDGFFVLPMDEYNFVDGVNLSVGGNSWFQLPALNCSNRASIILKLSQYFRTCCGSSPDVKILISNDEGVHWASFDMRLGTPTNRYCINPYPEVNISEVAGGMPNVWIRFQFNNNSHYFWCIDDLVLMEGYRNELQLENAWFLSTDLSAENLDEGFVYMIPNVLTGSNGFGGYTFRGAFINTGYEDQEECKLNAQVFKNGVSVYNQNSEEVTDIWSLQRDTVDLTTPFIPDGYGNYKMVLTAQQRQNDGVPENNTTSDTYLITDSIYSIGDWENEAYSSTASWGNNDGDYLGCVYDISKPVEANSISVYLMQRKENPQASTQIGYGFQYFIFYWNEEAGEWVELISAGFNQATAENLNTWITMPLEKDGEAEFLTPGQYIAAIQGFHGGGDGPDNNVYRFTIGSDLSHKYNSNKSVYKLIDGEGWSVNATDLSMIQLNLNATGAPTAADVVFNVDMTLPIANKYFNPANGDYLDIAGTFNNWTGSSHLTDVDGDGIYSLTVPGLNVFKNIEYKYRINGNWNTSEFPAGGANRVYRVTFYNMLSDVYNNGISMGVDTNPLIASIHVFPNPSEGLFTLNISNPEAAALSVSVTNLQGQVVYEKKFGQVPSISETLDLTRFAKGMYFLKANNQVIKLVVK